MIGTMYTAMPGWTHVSTNVVQELTMEVDDDEVLCAFSCRYISLQRRVSTSAETLCQANTVAHPTLALATLLLLPFAAAQSDCRVRLRRRARRH